MISYRPLFHLLLDRGMKKTDLLEIADISTGTAAKFGKNEPVNLKIIDAICQHFHCPISDIVEILPDES